MKSIVQVKYIFVLGQTFEPEINSWNDISWFDTQFVYMPHLDYYDTRSAFSRNLLESNLLYSLVASRLIADVDTKAKPDRSTLPTFHSYSQYSEDILTNFNNAQITDKPSDIVFIMPKNYYLIYGNIMKNKGLPYQLRISDNPLHSYIYGNERTKFWTLHTDSLLAEPLSYALLKIKVRR